VFKARRLVVSLNFRLRVIEKKKKMPTPAPKTLYDTPRKFRALSSINRLRVLGT
jgi:hypothetical protein